jgi:hypothetical protein
VTATSFHSKVSAEDSLIKLVSFTIQKPNPTYISGEVLSMNHHTSTVEFSLLVKEFGTTCFETSAFYLYDPNDSRLPTINASSACTVNPNSTFRFGYPVFFISCNQSDLTG